jgi:hypothetical protein
MNDALTILSVYEKIKNLEERLKAIEKEQRMICEDILSGAPTERMQKRILEKPSKKMEELKERLDKKIKIEI